jgi:hypothetical protein
MALIHITFEFEVYSALEKTRNSNRGQSCSTVIADSMESVSAELNHPNCRTALAAPGHRRLKIFMQKKSGKIQTLENLNTSDFRTQYFRTQSFFSIIGDKVTKDHVSIKVLHKRNNSVLQSTCHF